LSRLLQTENLAITLTTNIEEILLKMQSDSEEEFNCILKIVQKKRVIIGIFIL
jgi:hypothetical protein